MASRARVRTIDRRDFVRAVLADRGDLLVVSGLGSATYDIAAAGDHALNLYQWGGMGGTAMIGLGLALAKPDRRVVVFTGDGDMLMGLGSLATIGVKAPGNMVVIVLDNGHYGETGMQESHTSGGVDLVGVAKSCGLHAAHVSETEEATRVREMVHTGVGPMLLCVGVTNDELPRVLPTRDGNEMRTRFANAISSAYRMLGETATSRTDI